MATEPSGTTLQIALDSAFSNLVINEATVYKTSRVFTKGELPYGVALYSRVRHNHPDTGWSKWSNTVSFRVAVPSKIIGVAMSNANENAKGEFFWIDALGNRLSTFDWAQHPTYANIAMVTQDSDRAPVTLTRFPLFYVRTAASGPANSAAAGLKCWWISDVEEDGFHPAACFKRTTLKSNGKYIISSHCYMGTFLGHQETIGEEGSEITVLGSKRGQTVAASQTKATFKTWIENRNDASVGQSGWRMFDIWDLGALRTLLLIAKANSDTQTCWGDNSEGTAYPPTGSTNARAVFQGDHNNPIVSIEDLWRCYWYHADLITINTGVVTLTSPMDLTTTLSFGTEDAARYTQPTSSGWIRDVLDCPVVIGDDTHDLMELFLPASVVSAENLGTFSDYHVKGMSYPCGMKTGTADMGSQCGAFYCVDWGNAPAATHGSRLSKS